MTDSVFSKPILPKSTKEDEEIQWKSPILIAGIIVAVIIFSVWIALAISRKNNQQAEKTNQPTSLIPGVKIDQQKVAETTGELSDADPKSSLLVMGSLRTTYSGLLANWYTQEATNMYFQALETFKNWERAILDNQIKYSECIMKPAEPGMPSYLQQQIRAECDYYLERKSWLENDLTQQQNKGKEIYEMAQTAMQQQYSGIYLKCLNK